MPYDGWQRPGKKWEVGAGAYREGEPAEFADVKAQNSITDIPRQLT